MQFDYVIVGAGSAGCVLAHRLSENGKNSVCVLEAGGSDRRFWIQTPVGYGKTFYDKAVNWAYHTEPEPGLNDRQIYWPRGKVLGGSSSINAMVYIRGQHADYDDWAAMGNKGWSAADVLPYFKKAETNSRGGDQWRGNEGPLWVSDVSAQYHPVNRHFFDAAVECGIPLNPDFNSGDQEGVGDYQITSKNGFRMSAAKAYLRPALRRKNVHLEINAHATRLLFEHKIVKGVEYLQGSSIKHVQARREVIVSAGAVNTPQLLMLSGIGPATALQQHGIETIHHAEAVGRNLQDHLEITHSYRSREATLNNQLAPWWGKLIAGARYLLLRDGPLSIGVNQAGGFVRSNADRSRPNLQLYFCPVTYQTASPGKRPIIKPDPYAAFVNCACQCRPSSRGQVTLASANPLDPVQIKPNYLSTQEDLDEMIEGFHLLRKMANTPALRNVIAEEMAPGEQIHQESEIVDFIRQNASTVFHPTSTCTMGLDAANAVVDIEGRVYGVDRLRVVDASIFPTVISGNTNAPVIMVAEKIADKIVSAG